MIGLVAPSSAPSAGLPGSPDPDRLAYAILFAVIAAALWACAWAWTGSGGWLWIGQSIGH